MDLATICRRAKKSRVIALPSGILSFHETNTLAFVVIIIIRREIPQSGRLSLFLFAVLRYKQTRPA